LNDVFPSQESMNAISIIYFQYWLNFHVEEMLLKALGFIKGSFCFEKIIGPKIDYVNTH
jgi:hypothetical protein